MCKKVIFFSSFVVTGDLVNELLGDEMNLEEAIEKNRIFIVNHSIMDEILDAECNQVVSHTKINEIFLELKIGRVTHFFY